MSYEAWFAVAIKFYHSENSLFTRWIDFCSIKILKILIKGDTMRWPEGLFGSASQGDEKRGGEACWETDGERWRDSKTEKEQNTRDLLRKRERKRIRLIGAWHDRVSDDGCLCISLCLHQRHRNTTHTHSASSYKHRCSPIKQRWAISRLPPLSWLGETILSWMKPCSLLGNGPRKLIMLLPIGGKKLTVI